MFKIITFLTLVALGVAKPGHLTTHSVVEPAHVGSVVHAVPSAVSHQSFTSVHNAAAQVHPLVAPAVHTYHTEPVVHSAPVVHAAPIVQAPVVHTKSVLHTSVHPAQIVHTAQAYHSGPVAHPVPVLAHHLHYRH